MDVLIIGIAGGSGSGKSTLCRNIVSRFEGGISHIHHDDYYKSTDGLSPEERPIVGQLANKIRAEIEETLSETLAILKDKETET